MNAIILLVLFLYSHQNVASQFTMPHLKQNPYKIKIDRLEFLSIDSTMVDGFYKLTRHNRSYAYINASLNFKQDCCTSDVDITVIGYEFLSNEYRPYAIKERRKMCDFLQNEYKNIFRSDTWDDFLPVKCPIKKKIYTFYLADPETVDSSLQLYNLNLPFKKAKMEITLLKRNKPQFRMNGYYTLDHDLAIRERNG